jgi:hypothetical protein
MSSTNLPHTAMLVMLAAWAIGAGADDKADYDRRAAARYHTLFQSLDLDGDGTVTRSEARGDLNFSPRFTDMDINRDGIVTLAELQRFIEQEHGVRTALAR